MHEVARQRQGDESEVARRTGTTSMDSGTGIPVHFLAEPPTVAGRTAAGTELVPLSDLVVRGSPRDVQDQDHIQRLAEIAEELPPILVLRPTMRVIDGIHRLRAAESRGHHYIEVEFVEQADDQEAFVLAVRSNVAHGLPLTLQERKAAAWHIVSSYPQWSDRAVATVVGLSHRTIGAVRQEVAGDGQVPLQRVGRDGRSRPTDSSMRRERAAELLQAEPGASNREIARTVELSPATVRDVRRRLDRGWPVHGPIAPGPVAGNSSADSADPGERTGPAGVAVDLLSTIRSLRNDPSVRFSEAGRALLHYLELHRRSEGGWGELVDQLPTHSLQRVRQLAEHCARDWERLGTLADRRVRGGS